MAYSREKIETDYLTKVKQQLEILGDDPDVDASIRAKMLAVMNYLCNGGASTESIHSPLGISCVAIGVNDLLERKAGGVDFSPAFRLIANQVARE